MNDALLWAALVCGLLNLTLLIVLFIRWSGLSANLGSGVRDELRSAREEAQRSGADLRQEVAANLKSANDTLATTLTNMGGLQQRQLEALARQLKELTESNQAALDRVRNLLDQRVKELQESNEKRLEEVRKTVDEKLQTTLEKRLGESFKLVSERLESVHKGLGEMQNLATGVGDLKRVLTNVKARGTWAEVQLGAILEQILAPEQFERNVHTKQGSAEVVEFAVRLPGAKDDPDSCVWLPIDSKFPQEDYVRIQEAAERADVDAIQKATDALARAFKTSAKDIHDKYLDPPATTDFGIMFLATEGLYAEALRQPGLIEELQHRYRVIVAGPTTIAAILSSLRMGFQTLVIEQRASEVWRVLRAVKTEFGKFEDVLEKVKRQLQTATKTLEATGTRSRVMERTLRGVEKLPDAESSAVFNVQGFDAEIANGEDDTAEEDRE